MAFSDTMQNHSLSPVMATLASFAALSGYPLMSITLMAIVATIARAILSAFVGAVIPRLIDLFLKVVNANGGVAMASRKACKWLAMLFARR